VTLRGALIIRFLSKEEGTKKSQPEERGLEFNYNSESGAGWVMGRLGIL
jgi:hypothetical protein